MCFLNLCCNMYNVYSNELKDTQTDIMDFANLMIFDDIYTLPEIIESSMLIKPDVIFIDFVQNIQTPWVSGYESMATVARTLQQLAIQSNATVFELAQLSNAVWKTLSEGDNDFITMKGAWEFNASSDIIFAIRSLENQLWLTVVKTKYAQKPKEEIIFTTDFWRSKFFPVKKLSSTDLPF